MAEGTEMEIDTKIMMQLRTSLEEAMERHSIRPRTLSLQAGLGETAVRDIVSGRTKDVKLATVQKLADALGMDFYNLMIPDGPIDPKTLMPISASVERGVWGDGIYSNPSNWRAFTGRGDVEFSEDEIRYALEVKDDSADTVFPRGSILDIVVHGEAITGFRNEEGEIVNVEPRDSAQLLRSDYVVAERHRDGPFKELTVWKLERDDFGNVWLVSLSSKPEFQGAEKICSSITQDRSNLSWTIPTDMRLGSVIGAYIPYGMGYVTHSY